MDRHEYEINQLINPKKDIVKSNSKHRDKIETLILGRRIGGIVGGEEPPQKTLWKKVPDTTGRTMICEVIGDDILILPKNIKGETPIVQNGTIVAFAPYPETAFVEIWVNPLNAKGFNIPSSGWLEKTISENIGDPVPNWNEYQEL